MLLKRRIDYIEIDGDRVDLVFEPGRRKTISLKVSSPDFLVLKHPVGVKKGVLLDLLETKRDWLEKRIKTLKKAEKDGFGGGISEGGRIFFKGEIFEIRFEQGPIRVSGDKLLVPAGTEQGQLDLWYKSKTVEMVEDFLKRHENIPADFTIKVKRQKRIWGSCNSQRRIYINTRLSMCSREVFEYVIWHELCHLDHMNHSHRFYEEMERACPDYKKHGKWLKENAVKLKI